MRPEDLELGGEGNDGRVEVVEHTGLDTLLIVRVGGDQLRYLARDRNPLRAGDAVAVTVDPAKVHLFDASGARRLN